MKCIRLYDRTIVRVSDTKAAVLVANGEAQYVSRQEWKDAGRNYVIPTRRASELLAKSLRKDGAR